MQSESAAPAHQDHAATSREKVLQAEGLLVEEGIDCWLLLARETGTGFVCDPSVELLIPGSVIGMSVYGFTRDGRHFAVVAGYDVAQTEGFGIFDRVYAYDEAPDDVVRAALDERAPRSIGVNFSESDHGSDGITYGQLLWLRRASGPEHAGKIRSAERVAERLRAVKTASEVVAMQRSIAVTHELFKLFGRRIVAGATEAQLHSWMHAELRSRGLVSGWDPRWCPTLTIGPTSPVGHTQPTDLAIQPGETLAIDFGVRLNGYCSDLQRTWYLPLQGETQVAEEVARAFDAIRGTIRIALGQLRPGVTGYEVDAPARAHFLSYGYKEFMHGVGHQVGRMAHDGGGVLAPLWPATRERASRIIEPGQIFTLELGVVTSRGLVSLEEMALVTENGARIISGPEQTAVWLLPVS